MSAKKQDVWPKHVTVGRVTVPVYRRATGGFRVVFEDEKGKPTSASFSDESKAMQEAEKIAQRLSTFGARVAGVKPDQIETFLRCQDKLAPFEITLDNGVDALVTWLKRFNTTSLETLDRALSATPAAAVADVDAILYPLAVDKFLADKEAKGTGELHLGDMGRRLKRAKPDWQCNVSTITVQFFQEWLDKQKLSAANYNNFRRCFSSFFSWCVRHKYHTENPARAVGRRNMSGIETRVERPGETEVFSPAEMVKLLAAAKESVPEFLPALAICGFAGVRVTELIRLKWSDIDLKSGYIILEVKTSKTVSRRAFQMSANLTAWLAKSDAPRTGYIWTNRVSDTDKKWLSKTINRICDAQWQCAELSKVKWKKNAPRHSYVTYRFALTGNAEETASEAGNSPARLHKNYKALRLSDGTVITKELADAWFKIEIPSLN